MSGLEVVGVVLGSLPLVISALEHYSDGINTAKRYWRYKSEMRSLILQVNTERSLFINTLEQLLVGVVRAEHMADFLSSPSSPIWRETGIDEKLRDRLQTAHDIYLDNVSGMDRSLKCMMEKLALDPDGKPQFSDPNLFKQEYKRLKFSLSKSEYAEQLKDLRNYNLALARLTKQSLELEPTRSESKSRCPNFNGFQNYARNIFEILRASLRCSCENHAVKLRLESRSHSGDKEEDLLAATSVRIIFTYTSLAASPLSTWEEADIRYISEKSKCVPITARDQQSPNSTQKHSKRVRFDQQQVQGSSQASTVTITNQKVVTPATSSVDEIVDICDAFTKFQIGQIQNKPCAGYLLDSLKRKHGVYPQSTIDHASPEGLTAFTLQQVLTRHAKISRRLTQLDKLRVAVHLASSVLQLYKTPWLQEDWNNNDIYFVHRPGTPLSTIYQHPFIYRKLSPTPPTQCTTPQSSARRVIRNQTLFTLGVMLIELFYGKTMHELETPRDLDCQGTPGVVWCTAQRLIEEEIAFEAGPLYADAVRRCIRCDFNRKESSLDDQDFQQAVFHGVVVPLEKTLQRFNGLD